MGMLTVYRVEATAAAQHRGHSLKWTKPYTHGARKVQDGWCVRCGKEVQIIDHPAPNEIEVGGEAVALHCVS
jgi:hypothetical protein